MRLRGVVLFAVVVVAATVLAQAPADAAPNPLAPIAWIIGDWHATAGPGSEKPTQIDNHVYWGETKTAIFFLTRFNGEPHYTGMYAYDTGRKQIAFWYVDDKGNFTQGVAHPDGKRLVHEFTTARADGTRNTLRSLIDRHADDNSYHWQVVRGDDPKPLVELDYTRKK